MDAIKNFAKVTVSTGYDASATSIALSSGEGAKLPAPATDGAFNLVWWNSTDYPDPSDDPNVEITRCTARSTDTLTVTRAQESTSASTKNTGGKTYKMMLALSYKVMMDLKNNNPENMVRNGQFINNSTNGYGGTADDFTSSNANPVQGGLPALTKQQLIDALTIGADTVADGDIEGLWNLNEASGDAVDLSANGYNLTDTNTVGASDDGLMGQARDFELANSEYFVGAGANANITGAQTWFVMIKPETVLAGSDQDIMCIRNSGGGSNRAMVLLPTGKLRFDMDGATTTASLSPDPTLETGKWYLVIGVFDPSNSKLKVWLNGVKKEATSTGASTAITGNIVLGRGGDMNQYYYDGLMQCAGILSKALTDAQAKALFDLLLYRRMKVRRATTDAYLYQELTTPQLMRVRGKDVTLNAKGYCSSTNHGIYVETDSTKYYAKPASANAWADLAVTVAIPATAKYVRYGLCAETTDGNSWFDELQLNEGAIPMPFQPSQDDQTRFPRLLKMDFPEFVRLKPYQYEEDRIYSWIPVFTTGTVTSYGTQLGTFSFRGKLSSFNVYLGYVTQTGTTGNMEIGMPIINRPDVNIEIDFCGRFLFYTGTTGRVGNYYMAQNVSVAGVRGSTNYQDQVWENKIYYVQFGGQIPIY